MLSNSVLVDDKIFEQIGHIQKLNTWHHAISY